MFDYKDDEENTGSQLAIIKDLMEQLVGEMSPGKDDFEERLGRKKPGLEIMKVEGKLPLGEAGEDPLEEKMETPDEEKMEDDMSGHMSMDDLSPQEKLKKRIMNLRA